MYKVELRFTYGWDDAGWTVSDDAGQAIPWRFESEQDAQQEIEELCNNMEYDPAEYRVVKAD